MGERTEQTFFQRGSVFNTAIHQGNANQNHNEVSPHTCQNGYHQKEHK